MFSFATTIVTVAIAAVAALSTPSPAFAQLPPDCAYAPSTLDDSTVMTVARNQLSIAAEGSSDPGTLIVSVWGVINKGGVQHADGGASCMLPRIVTTAKQAGILMTAACATQIAATAVKVYNVTDNITHDCTLPGQQAPLVQFVVTMVDIAPQFGDPPVAPSPAADGGRLYTITLLRESPTPTAVTPPVHWKPNDPVIDKSPDQCTYLAQNTAVGALTAPVAAALGAADAFFRVANPGVALYAPVWGVLAPAVDKRKDHGLGCLQAQILSTAQAVTIDVNMACVQHIVKTAFANKPGTVSEGTCATSSAAVVTFQVTVSIVKNVLILGDGVGVVYTLLLGKQLTLAM